MHIILLERVENLGQMGEEVKVKAGYARNYLLPQGKALRATDENRKYFESRRKEIEADNLKRRGEAESAAKDVEGKTVILLRQAGDSGQLYGSVAPRDIADALAAEGISVRRDQVLLDRPIKTLGMHPVRVALHPEVVVTVSANVARSTEEASLQASGVDMTLSVFEREELAAKAAAEETAAAAAAAAAAAEAGEEAGEGEEGETAA